jgi:putative effector of murein hydrolase
MNLFREPALMIGLTLGAYLWGQQLFLKYRKSWLNPVLVAIILIAIVLQIGRAKVEDYLEATRSLVFMLSPTVICLALILYEQTAALKKKALAIVVAVCAGGLVNVVVGVYLSRWLELPEPFVQAMSTKAVTTPIALELSKALGGEASLTVAFVLLSGIMGAVWGLPFLRRVGVKDEMATGLAIGTVSHGIGTARVQQESDLMAAAAALAMALNGLFTAFYLPYLYFWL